MVVRERDTEVFTARPLEHRPRSPSPVIVARESRTRLIERSPSPPPERVRTTRIIDRERRRPSPLSPERLRSRVIETREIVRERSISPPQRLRTRVIKTRERGQPRSPSPPPERIRVERMERGPSPPSIRERELYNQRVLREQPQRIITHHRHVDRGNYNSTGSGGSDSDDDATYYSTPPDDPFPPR
jgi:hypothetical protein